MEDLFKSATSVLITPKCHDVFFKDWNFLNEECLKSLLSRGLGLGIVAGSLLVKLPQIVKIYSEKSAEGISFWGVLCELLAIVANTAYSFVNRFPFSAWGDAIFLLIQTAVIMTLQLTYTMSTGIATGFVAVTGLVVYVLMSGLVPLSILWFMQAACIPLMLAGKLLQAFTNYKNHSVGQLSLATCLLLFLGSVARVFTSVHETGDSILILTYALASLANGIILSQFYLYWDMDKKIK
uniref:Mannose-P-dolichol utilization defect 1 protein homolog n=2 Tax=Cacopsylla melanoneura TaxID=428564 RepID=A0A8D8VZX6_9HEMI